MTLKEINCRIRKQAPHVELVRGQGYCYFIYDDGTAYETESVMIPCLNQYPAKAWIEDGITFSIKIEAELAEIELCSPFGDKK